MDKGYQFLSGRWLARMRALLMVCLLAVSQVARADSGAWYFGSQYFKWDVCGDGEIEFSIPIFIWDSSSNDAVTWGYIYVTPGNESETQLLYYAYDSSRDMDKPATFQAKANGDFQIMNTTSGAKSFNRNSGAKSWVLKRDSDDDDHHTAKIRWKVPYQWRGKTIKIRVNFRWDDRYKHEEPNYTLNSFNCPAGADASISLNEPMLAMEQSSAGMIMVPWYAQAKSISDVQLRLVDAATGHVSIQDVYAGNKLTGYINIPANRPYSDVQLSAKMVASDGMEIPDRVTSSTIHVNMLHNPTDFRAQMQPDGKVVLQWRVDLPEYEDIMEDDLFEIQRNLTGSADPSDASWITITQEPYSNGTESYKVVDEDLITRYMGKAVTYRIRRTAASFWGWVKDAGYAQVQIPANITIYGINDATVSRGAWNEDEHNVEFSFNLSGPETDADGCLILRNATDWEKFAGRVAGGETQLNAIMAGDIDLGDSQVMVGTADNPYAGQFDGNGYTLTVNYSSKAGYTAPFRYISAIGTPYADKSTSIRNLHVDGTIITQAKFAAGLVGHVAGAETNSHFYISNCHSSVAIKSTVNGDGTNGGFIAHVESNGNVYMKDCRFDGQFVGEKCINNGGFVGYTYLADRVSLTNCLFAPTRIDNYQGCKTFVRAPYGNAYINNSYYLTLFDGSTNVTIGSKSFFVIRTAADWDTFNQNVKNAGGSKEVNAIMAADIHTTDSIGVLSDVAFCGTFDGNGHTLDVEITRTGISAVAPFRVVSNATIKNLHVTGSVTGGIHSAGLIGSSSGSNTIENVRVSVKVTASGNSTNGPHSGGFVGHGNSSTIVIKNCLFDGSLVSTSWNDSYAGAFIGWGSGTIGFENNFENGTYVNYNHAGMCYHNSSAWGGSATNYSVHSWGEMKTDANRNAGSLPAATLASKLGSQWKVSGGYVVPVMNEVSIGQGSVASSMTQDEIKTALGDNWTIKGGSLLPVTTSEGGIYASTVWDSRAQLQLRIAMHGENGISYKYVDLTGNDDAMNKQRFTQELSRSCVDYSFDMIVRRGSSTLPIIGAPGADSVVYSVTKTETGDLASYRFQNNDSITGIEVHQKQSSVELVWTTSGGERDYFRILRREHGMGEDAWKEIATNLEQMFYEDKTVLAQQAYDYRVESIWQCEGMNVFGKTCSGECKPTGKVNGYIRMADGTAMAGVKVECRPNGTIPDAQPLYVTYTDETGYYEFSGLPFQGEGSYNVTVPVTGNSGSYTAPNADGEVSFSQQSNWTRNFNFFMDSYFVYSGNVYYRDTSIPVPGVSFKLDGAVMHDASQRIIETDNQGAFSLSIPSGPHSVQAFKEGHFFASDGFLLTTDDVEDKTQYNFHENVSEVYIWDSTTVTLRGRVVGGDLQGSLPLGMGLSKNNLGDSIRIVIQLEGDNASYLIRKQDDETVKSDSYDVHFGPGGKNTAGVDVTRHTITIHPDAETGEYQIPLHPAKYKVTEVSAQGYATLFQSGKVGETIDLSFKVKGDTCVYNRIYHSMPTVDVTQFNPGGEKYFGIKQTTATDNIGNKAVVNVWGYKKTGVNDSIPYYSFGYPVFMSGTQYGFMFQACEKYYWNNDYSKNVDIVNLDENGKIIIKNAMTTDSKTAEWEARLDSAGGASYVFVPDNTTFVLDGTNALKNIDITLQYDGSYYDVKPFNGGILKGYVMATKAKNNGRKGVLTGIPQLIDILRDPPGGGSSAYIEEGSKLSYGYQADLSGSAGLVFGLAKGENAQIYNGTVVIPSLGGGGTEAGVFQQTEKKDVFSIEAITYYGHNWNFSYNFDVTERIQTKTGAKWIGGKADLFIGMTTEILAQDAIAVRVIPKDQYMLMKTHEGGTFQAEDENGNTANIKVPVGTMKVLSEGIDPKGDTIYLVRDEVLAVGPKVASTFIHSQNYIENELLPELIKVRNSLLLPKETSTDDALAIAKKQGYTAYISNVDPDDDLFGFSYTPVVPDGGLYGDSISTLNQAISTWIGFLAKNEEEKLSVREKDLVKRYDVDGGAASIQYSETFTITNSESQYLRFPGINDLSQAVNGVLSVIKTFVKSAKHWFEINGKNVDNKPKDATILLEENDRKSTVICSGGTYLSFTIKPAISLNFNDKNSLTKTNSKKIGYTLSMATKSSLTVDVYRTAHEYSLDIDNSEFNQLTVDMLDMLRTGKLGSNIASYISYNETVYSSFVFRTRGGVTCQPYEGERTTKWYQPGTVLDVATIAADKPRIWIDEPVVNNVPFDEPARFVLHFANETDYPERVTFQFNYYLLGSSNPNGAKVCVDGKELSSSGESIVLYPVIDGNGKHTVFTKEITVYPSKAFDYEDLTICLVDPEDPMRVFSQTFSAHFIPTAGKVRVTVPSNNWVINTESPYDGLHKAWYMPVRIEGFDVNYPNFDHIELQYKLSTQGDKDWVSVCSYYQDRELKAKSSGVTDTIPSNGIIIARFFGETDPIEQYYDLRAVTYCRYAGGYLTGMSDVLTGIKDTRLPKPFGTPDPSDGILDPGDDIKIMFSEPIAGNYLRNINNFEVLGKLSGDLSTSTSLSFSDMSIAVTNSRRSLTDKSFSVDVMLNPSKEKRDMTVFCHGDAEKGLTYGITADRRLFATINGQKAVSDSVVAFNNDMHRVVYVLDQSGENMKVSFYDGSEFIGSKVLKGKHEGSSSLVIGRNLLSMDNAYNGEMLEFRLWNRAMTSAMIDNYSGRSLTGNESGLLDYYPMNEGEGDWCYDLAAGANDLYLVYTNWKLPQGISVELKGEKGLILNPDKFTRSNHHDYTLTFWFRSTEPDGTLFSNGQAVDRSSDQINIGLRDNQLYVRSSGFEKQVMAYVGSGEWHHFVMSVNRSRNVANIYLDKQLIESFPADSLKGIGSNPIALGATYDKNEPTYVLTGNIDEVGMFASALPFNLIKEFHNHTPISTLSSLLVYLDFGRSVKSDNNTQQLEPTGISMKRYIDLQGKMLERRDTIVSDQELEVMTTRDEYAPMTTSSKLDNLKYGFTTHENELLIDIEEPDYMIEKTNVYITVKDVPDLQGNLMASPLTMNLYIYRNPLRWDVKRIERDIKYGNAETFEATIRNLSGIPQDYELKELPIWVTASQTSGIVGALDEQKITFTVSPYINIGTYNEQVSLNIGNNLFETLPLVLRVRGDEPDWSVSDEILKKDMTMMMMARVKINGSIASSSEDILGVFDDKHQVLGVARIEVDNTADANESLAFVTINGYTNDDGSKPTLNFKFFSASSGRIYNLVPERDTVYTFRNDAILGSASDPVVLVRSLEDEVQTIHLNKGWNWVSFNVIPNVDEDEPPVSVKSFLGNYSKWEPGDMVSSIKGSKLQMWMYRSENNPDDPSKPIIKWDNEDDVIYIDPELMYMIYSSSEKTVAFEGCASYSGITVHKNWNRIAYTSGINLPIAQALSDYTENAADGDIIKSQEGFAIATRTAQGLVWKGTLHFMEAGKGYMLKRMADSEVRFSYPIYFSESRYNGTLMMTSPSRISTRASEGTSTTMNIVARIVGVDTFEGDILVAWCGAERLAESVADEEGVFYLNIGSDARYTQAITFSIERDGKEIAVTGSNIVYESDAVIGSPSDPTLIRFGRIDADDMEYGKWYSVSGMELPGKPSQPGFYIHNGIILKME